jgi:hypothetical protein
MLIQHQESKTMFKFIHPYAFGHRRSGSLSGIARRTVTLMAVLGAGVAVMGAQTDSHPQASLNLKVPAMLSSSDAAFSSSATSSATADAGTPVNEASVVPMTPNFAEMMQYGGGQRKRYGRPRYRGNNTNADGSSKWIFFAGAGLSQPIGNTWHYLTPSYAFQVGVGRQFSKKFAVPVQFDYDHFGMAAQTLNHQTTIYDALYGGGSVDGILDGSSHVWSFTVDPTLTFYSGDTWGAYGVVGAGYYHKTAAFTVPSTQQYCDPYYGCSQYQANTPIDKYTSNAPGFNGGFGITYKISRFANERLYAEARYVFVDNSQKAGITVNNLSTITATTTNFYPANSNRTTFIPIKVGIRF